MELLYIWINKGKNIIQQGYNFSMEYRFEMIYENRKMILVGTDKKLYGAHFFDEDGIITNITAIVGKNGVGKTSLLQEVCRLDCYPKFKEEREEYIGFEQEEYEKNKKLLIFRKEKAIGEIEPVHMAAYSMARCYIYIMLLDKAGIEDEKIVQCIEAIF